MWAIKCERERERGNQAELGYNRKTSVSVVNWKNMATKRASIGSAGFIFSSSNTCTLYACSLWYVNSKMRQQIWCYFSFFFSENHEFPQSIMTLALKTAHSVYGFLLLLFIRLYTTALWWVTLHDFYVVTEIGNSDKQLELGFYYASLSSKTNTLPITSEY